MAYDWRRSTTSEVIRQYIGFVQQGVEHTADGKALAAEIDRRIPTSPLDLCRCGVERHKAGDFVVSNRYEYFVDGTWTAVRPRCPAVIDGYAPGFHSWKRLSP